MPFLAMPILGNNSNMDQVKKIRPYALLMIPFLALFAYELAVILPHRPRMPDLVHGYTIAMGRVDKAVYVSAGDLILIFGTWLCGAAVLLTGVWRAGLLQRALRR